MSMRSKVVDWCSAKLFHLIHSNNLVYNTCWEDPALDRVALDFQPSDRVMMITSAGCNALDYALANPAQICAVDVNPRQNALLELKIAGIRSLDYETFFSIFGLGGIENFAEIYQFDLRPHLSPLAQRVWDRNLDYFSRTKSRHGFYFRGTSGAIAKIIHHYIDLTRTREGFDALLNAQSVDEQSAIYFSDIKELLWNKAVRWAVSTDASLSFVGVPRPQRKQVEVGYVGGIAQFIEDCVETVFTKIPLSTNYFWRLYLTGGYTKSCCPEYLEYENFVRLREGLVDKISVHTDTILDFLNRSQRSFNRFVLLDHMDWLSTYNLPVLRREWQAIVNHADENSRMIWRSGGMKTDFVDDVFVQVNGRTHRLGDRLTYQRELARELHAKDRVHTYGSFYIADLMAV